MDSTGQNVTRRKSPPATADTNAIRRGRLIRMQRLAKGWEPSDLAKAADVSERTVARAEDGDEKTRESSLLAIAKALDMDCCVLLEPAGVEKVPAANVISIADADPAKVKVTVSFTFDMHILQLLRRDEAERMMKHVQAIAEIAQGVSKPVVDVGSTKLTVEMTVEDAKKLGTCFLNGSLKQLGIIAVEIPTPEAAHKNKIASLRAMSRGMTGVAGVDDLLRKEAAIRFAYRLVLLGQCEPIKALQVAEKILAENGGMVPPMLDDLSAPREAREPSAEEKEVMDKLAKALGSGGKGGTKKIVDSPITDSLGKTNLPKT